MARILVIDDDDQLRTLLVRVLTQAQHEVQEASNGREGYDMVQSFSPDLVITDIVMPEQEGIETIMALRREQPDTPVIAMSGGAAMGSGGYLDIAEKLGAARTLSKPFLPADLTRAVDEVLAGVTA